MTLAQFLVYCCVAGALDCMVSRSVTEKLGLPAVHPSVRVAAFCLGLAIIPTMQLFTK